MIKGAKLKKSINEKIYDALVFALLFIFLVLAVYLAVFSLIYSVNAPTDYDVLVSRKIINDNVIVNILVLVAALVLLFFAKKLINIPKIKQRAELISIVVLVASAVLFSIISLIYLSFIPYYPAGDQILVTAAASYFSQGNYTMLTKSGYISMYSFQEPLTLGFEFIFSIFGDLNFKAIGILNFVASLGTLIAGWFVIKFNCKEAFARIVFCFAYLGCVPVLMMEPYAYGDVPSYFYTVLVFLFLSLLDRESEHSNKHQMLNCILLVIATVFFATMAVLNRGNSWIAVIAIGIACFLYIIKKKRFIAVIPIIAIVVTTLLCNLIIHKSYDKRSGYDFEGIPMVLWVAMGMQETDDMPGKYNRYQQQIFENTDFNVELSKQIGKEYMSERIGEFKADPEMAHDFYTRKIRSQWFEPTFEAFRHMHTFEGGIDNPTVLTPKMHSFYYGRMHDFIWNYSNIYQSIIYAGLLIYVLRLLVNKFRKKDEEAISFLIPMITIIGGFIFSIIWENQCRYVLPYYLFILMYSSIGLANISLKGDVRANEASRNDNDKEKTSS